MFRFAKFVVIYALLPVALMSGCANISIPMLAEACVKDQDHNFTEVLACYKKQQASQPLYYTAKEVQQLPGIEKRSFALMSQNWSPDGLIKTEQWKHKVDIYIPVDALPGRALLVANNGINYPNGKDGVKPASDMNESMALSIAKQTRTIIVVVSDIPNQYLTYTDDNIARREDDSVAHSWKLFLENPEARPFMSLHIPMMESIIKAMDLAQKELQPWQVNHFIATGASKRAWSAWLATIADDRINAIVPFVIDFMNIDQVLNHTYHVYGGSWPLAFTSYQREGITKKIKTENFGKLMRIEDPLRYLSSAYAERLKIPKYIVNASSDDFFVPDNSQFYFDQLAGQKALRVAPNASHFGIREFIEESLISVINRLQQGRALPAINVKFHEEKGNKALSLQFSEAPLKITQWTAVNPVARDFRYACGIRYQPTELKLTEAQSLSVSATIQAPKEGWGASFIEAKFGDGLVTTTPVYVMPQTYPVSRPPVIEPGCKTVIDAL
ncbi:MAG: PhoPQ-activated protein PqaA family protein [Pseudomonadota bacterium]